ncbi:MAG: hypothetical protein EOM77_01060 [Bacteroidia bacterium]|nr:hypothetical protein [Bacteroidia bacterium]
MKIWDNERRLLSLVNNMRAKVMIGGQLGQKVSLRSESFTGVKTIGLFWFKEGISCRIDTEMEVSEGRAKLLLVHKGQLIPILLEAGKDTKILKFERGFARLRIVGDHASLKLHFSLTKGVTYIE